jgi:signal transduction histidine kinase
MTGRRPVWDRLYVPAYVTAGAVVCGWVGVYLAFRGHWLGVALPLLATCLTLVALRRGDRLARASRARLRAALETAAARNRALERLSQLASVMLQDVTLPSLFQAVADAAADLLQAEGAGITLLVEEGRFLRFEATAGTLAGVKGDLLPSNASLSGWVVQHDQPVVSDDVEGDARAARMAGFTSPMRTGAVVPLRSAGVVIGTLGVVNRRDGQRFDDDDLKLLRTLGDQAVVALDRARTFEEIRRNERDLTAKNVELERATRLKSEFLANMSHELRTPLNAIIGFSDLILSGGLGEVSSEQRDLLEAVLRNGRHLLALINSVLDLSKIEAGRMTLALAATDLHEAITGAVADTASLRTAKHQECQVHMDDGALQVVADGVRVRQILFNLLSNASKFTPDRGQIALTVVRTSAPLPLPADRAGEQARLVPRDAVWVAVSDTGIGIRPEDMDKLFQEFSQVDSSASRQQQGTGLGLALSRRFVELHGGTIGAESIHGKGSTFWFILPVDGPVRRGALRAGAR